MTSHLQPVCFVLGLVAMATPAAAQTWVYENEPGNPADVPAYTVAPSQRTTIDRTIIPQGNGRAPLVRERVVTDTYAPGVTVTAPAAGTVTTDYTARNIPSLDDRYVDRPRPGYTEPVVESYTYAPRPPLSVTDGYAYVPPAPTVQAPATAMESYAYVPNGAAGPRVVYERDASYCAQRYRSYDPVSGTFLGYDGVRHACP